MRFDMHRAITKAILETVGTDFLLLDGTRAMTGNLDMGNNEIVSVKNLYPEGTGVGALGRSANYWNSAHIVTTNFFSLLGGATASVIASRNILNSSITFKYRATEVAKIENDFLGISRAGDIIQLATKTSALRASTIGDGGTTHYVSFATDGELNLHGTARIIKGRWVPAQAIRAPTIKPATYVDHGISGAWEFSDGQEEIIVCTMKIPDNVDMTEDLEILIGWSSPTVSQDCDWEIAYLLTKLNDPTNAAAQQTLQSFETSSANANGLIVSTFTIDNAAQIEAADVCVHIKIMRDGNDAGDTLGDVAHIHGICLQYTSDKLGVAT